MLNVGVAPSKHVPKGFAKLIVKSLIDTEIEISNEYNHKPLPEKF